jgi:tRNA (guanine37-N1)-methyltransferase
MGENSLEILMYTPYTEHHPWYNKIVPDILLSGDHQKIVKWHQVQAEAITQKRRFIYRTFF